MWDNDEYRDRRDSSYQRIRDYQQDVQRISKGAQDLTGLIELKFARLFLWSWAVSPFLTIGMFAIAPITVVAAMNPAQTEYNVSEVLRCASGKSCIFSQVIDCAQHKSLCTNHAFNAAMQRQQAVEAKYRSKGTAK